jgi:hypothetical protein
MSGNLKLETGNSATLTTKIDKQFLFSLCADAISNLELACEKYPTFPGAYSDLTVETAHSKMCSIMRINESYASTARTISHEEELELTVAILRGMRQQSYDELVDVITVWLRVGCHLGDYVSKAETGNSKLETGEASHD